MRLSGLVIRGCLGQWPAIATSISRSVICDYFLSESDKMNVATDWAFECSNSVITPAKLSLYQQKHPPSNFVAMMNHRSKLRKCDHFAEPL